MKILVGNTGFVGSNLALLTSFERMFNSKNIKEAYGSQCDLLVYAGVRAEKFLANQYPEQDKNAIEQAIYNIDRIKAKRVVLISTIDVYKDSTNLNEDIAIDENSLPPYGLHRRILEKWILQNNEQSLIVRLPALYGKNIKKNFIFDMMTIIPSMIKEELFIQIMNDLPDYVVTNYVKQDNGFYKLGTPLEKKKAQMKDFFKNYTFNALSFTDSRSRYQFYPLQYLWQHIQTALEYNLQLLCVNSEPISAAELYQYVFEKDFVNIITEQPAYYDLRSKYAELFGGKNGYLFDKQFILEDICRFVTGGIKDEASYL